MTEQDCQGILAKLVKHEHLSRLKPPITLRVWDTWGSYGSYRKHYITIARRGLELNYHYGLALVIHEFSHIVTWEKHNGHHPLPHGREFKRTENRLLKLFGLSIKRQKAYATAIYHEGIEVWHK